MAGSIKINLGANNAMPVLVGLLVPGDHLGSIKCCFASCKMNTASYGWGIKRSLGADNAVPVPKLVGLLSDAASVSAAPLTKYNLDLICSVFQWCQQSFNNIIDDPSNQTYSYIRSDEMGKVFGDDTYLAIKVGQLLRPCQSIHFYLVENQCRVF